MRVKLGTFSKCSLSSDDKTVVLNYEVRSKPLQPSQTANLTKLYNNVSAVCTEKEGNKMNFQRGNHSNQPCTILYTDQIPPSHVKHTTRFLQ